MENPDAYPEDPLAEVSAAEDGPQIPVRSRTPGGSGATAPAVTPGAHHPLAPLLAGEANMWRTEELLDLGLSARHIGQWSDPGGALIKVRRGCYVRSTFRTALDAKGASRCRMDAYAHRTLTSSTAACVFSHITAARLHGLYLWDAGDTIHVTVPYLPSAGNHASDVRAHTRPLAAADIVRLRCHRATSLTRTAADSCQVLSYSQALILMDHALRLGASRAVLDQECAARPGAPGVAMLRKVLGHADPLSESPGETLARDLIRRLRLPARVLQFEVRTRFGNCRLDGAWPERRVALEFDGRSKHFDYAPTPDAIFAERRREKALTELGWKFVRIEWRDLFRERELKARLLEALGR